MENKDQGAAAPRTATLDPQAEITRLKQEVRRLEYLAMDNGIGIWRCDACGMVYTTAPSTWDRCGETVFIAEGSRACHGVLRVHVPALTNWNSPAERVLEAQRLR